MDEGVAYLVEDPTAWYRWGAFAGLTWTVGQLARGHRRWLGVNTYRRGVDVHVAGWYVGVSR